MITDVIIVPKDKCPLDVLAELGSKTENAWIFLHASAIERLQKTADTIKSNELIREMEWKQTINYPASAISFEVTAKYWSRVYRINASNIAFNYEPCNPECILFLKMAD